MAVIANSQSEANISLQQMTKNCKVAFSLRPYSVHDMYLRPCRSNIVERYKLNDSFDSVECRFRQQFRTKFRSFDEVETNRTCSICFDFVERTKFRSTLLPFVATKANVASTMLLVWTGPIVYVTVDRDQTCANAVFFSVFQPSSIRGLATPWTYFLPD